MPQRRRVRELALQVLFLWDARGDRDDAMAARLAGPEDDAAALEQAVAWAGGAWDHRSVADAQMARLAPQWPPHRQPGVDRSLLRLAIWELSRTDTPPKVVINEAIEMAKTWSTEQSPAFINGVLDAVLHEIQEERTKEELTAKHTKTTKEEEETKIP
jgi:transcription antitermination protein NusB